MNKFQNGIVRAVAESFELPEPILELGAYQVAGQESNLRNHFSGREYLGVDIRPGPGVDLVADVEKLPQHDASVGTVIAMSTFEHVRRFWKGLEEVHRVLRPNGAFLVCCPFYFHLHNYPNDYWRFTPEAYHVLLENYSQRLVGCHGPKSRPLAVWALAFREEAPKLNASCLDRYRQRMTEYAHEPLPWRRKLRYQIGRLLCGGGPFAKYLEVNRWDLEYRCMPPVPDVAAAQDRNDRRSVREMEESATREPVAPGGER